MKKEGNTKENIIKKEDSVHKRIRQQKECLISSLLMLQKRQKIKKFTQLTVSVYYKCGIAVKNP